MDRVPPAVRSRMMSRVRGRVRLRSVRFVAGFMLPGSAFGSTGVICRVVPTSYSPRFVQPYSSMAASGTGTIVRAADGQPAIRPSGPPSSTGI